MCLACVCRPLERGGWKAALARARAAGPPEGHKRSSARERHLRLRRNPWPALERDVDVSQVAENLLTPLLVGPRVDVPSGTVAALLANRHQVPQPGAGATSRGKRSLNSGQTAGDEACLWPQAPGEFLCSEPDQLLGIRSTEGTAAEDAHPQALAQLAAEPPQGLRQRLLGRRASLGARRRGQQGARGARARDHRGSLRVEHGLQRCPHPLARLLHIAGHPHYTRRPRRRGLFVQGLGEQPCPTRLLQHFPHSMPGLLCACRGRRGCCSWPGPRTTIHRWRSLCG
mmetsp:Transcript_23711/g.68453  ORF Transcript_23711/g.68453 Transcript_23711/m.68453 type:complete len:285 (+) Transcript_23711:370-1224(+)